jgi:hypothetical protein
MSFVDLLKKRSKMTTEAQGTIVENTQATSETQTPQYSEIEQQAIDQGWRPKEDYAGEPGKWVSADIFVARAPLFEHISSQKKELSELRRALKDVVNTQGEIRKQEFANALAQLKLAKRDALVDNDADRVIDLDERIELVKDAQRQAAEDTKNQITQEAQEVHPEFTQWTSQNAWYNNDEAMRAWADAQGRVLARSGHTPSQVLKEISKQVREEFPKRFTNQNRERPGAVESSTTKSASGKSDSYSMSDLERSIMKKVVATGVMTEKEYVSKLKESNS